MEKTRGRSTATEDASQPRESTAFPTYHELPWDGQEVTPRKHWLFLGQVDRAAKVEGNLVLGVVDADGTTVPSFFMTPDGGDELGTPQGDEYTIAILYARRTKIDRGSATVGEIYHKDPLNLIIWVQNPSSVSAGQNAKIHLGYSNVIRRSLNEQRRLPAVGNETRCHTKLSRL